MMMIDENDDVNGANGIGVIGECEDFGVTEMGCVEKGELQPYLSYVVLLGTVKQFNYQQFRNFCVPFRPFGGRGTFLQKSANIYKIQ
jgi:hypothetical protein